MGKLFSYFEAALAEKKSAFAVYRKPGEKVLRGFFGYEDANHPFSLADAGFVFVPFGEGKKIFIPAESAVVLAESFDAGKANEGEVNAPREDAKARAAFEKLVGKSIDAINGGQFEKLVCSRAETVKVESLNAVATFKKLAAQYPNAFCYCFFSPESGLWMGATPEQLLRVNDGILQTVALAGTQVYSETEKATWQKKEQQEQQFVTDYIVGSLKNFVENIEESEPYTFRAGNLVHIKTDIAAKTGFAPLEAIINALHPTPAVCGLPKDEAKQFLLEQEEYDREYYAGYLGEVNMGQGNSQTDLFVNLRCMKVEDETVRLFVGCGITKDSDPEKEFSETVNKSMTMRKVL
ncbi:MAG: isochorismate synthase [Flavobacterium sp.]